MYYPGTLGCQLNHWLSVVELLKDSCEYYVVLEDNAVLVDDFNERIQNVIQSLSDQSWDIIHLFSTLRRDREEFIPGIFIGCDEWGTAKAHLISKRYAMAMVTRLPFHEVADGISMIPSMPWMKTNLISYVTYPYVAGKSRSLKPARVASDNKYLRKINEIIRLEDTALYYLKALKSNGLQNPPPALCHRDPCDLFLAREMFLLGSGSNGTITVHPVTRRESGAILKEFSILPPPHDILIQPIRHECLKIVTEEGLCLAYDAESAVEVSMHGVPKTVVWIPKDIRLPENAISCHFKSHPSLSRALRFAV
ncbi:hypothetical protein EVJ50_05730 [Synechococcus sp. RSCCF101]|uniref:hypothetical protein n=1 Tax=Synechococcus sp. RSCCF101 TaxID=2511069 RepID=UPI001248E683|nr:hypothetical protein [Synechococcus sp. RSCCF101]QEY31815.1 hypothetical protein EVJ50_05730 [Synechococcus sp. RSCCF101]